MKHDRALAGVGRDPVDAVIEAGNVHPDDLIPRDRHGAEPGRIRLRIEPDTSTGIAPAPGGRVVPNVSIADAMTGKTSLLINPAVPAMSDFQ